jgi:hypothetical protein
MATSAVGPKKTKLPFENKYNKSNMAYDFELAWWMLRTTVWPLLLMPRKCSTTCMAAVESNPEVGSSNKSMGDRWSSEIAIDSRRFWPPEIPLIKGSPTRVSAQVTNPISSINPSIFSALLDAGNEATASREA